MRAKAMDELAENWTSKHKWKGEFDFGGELDIWIAPPEWQIEEEWLGRFWLDVGPDDTWDDAPGEDCFWLTRLCRKGKGMLGFRWYPNSGIPAKKARWKKFVRDNVKLSTSIGKKGFVCEDTGRFFMEFKIDADKLITALQDDDFETAFQPMQAALDRLDAATPEFDAMLKLAKETFQ
jgi:hypothetical protein